MKLLTHYASKNYLEELKKLAKQASPDEELIQDITSLTRDRPQSSKALPFQDDLIEIINYLRTHPSDKNANIVRGTLTFLTHNYAKTKDEVSLSSTSSGRDTCSMILKIAVSAIRIDESKNYLIDCLGLTTNEKTLIQDLFEEFCDVTPYNDAELCEFTSHHIEEISSLKNSHIHKRFIHHLQILIGLLKSEQEIDLKIVRGALSYVYHEDDIIPDNLGLIGFLDDMYVTSLAIGRLKPDYRLWDDKIDEYESQYPFLRSLTFDYQEINYCLNELDLINFAVFYNDEGENRSEVITMVMPRVGLTSIISAYLFAMINAYKSTENTGECPFNIGDKVKVDNLAIKVFAGVENYEGIEYLRLEGQSKTKGMTLESANFIPVEQWHRLCPADENAAFRGNTTTFQNDSDTAIPPLDILFGKPVSYGVPDKRIWVVTSTVQSRDVLDKVDLFGWPLKDVMPISYLKRNGELVSWNKSFSQSEPFIVFSSDLDSLAEAVEEYESKENDIIIVDLKGANRSRRASIARLMNFPCKKIFLAEEQDSELHDFLLSMGSAFWEWKRDEIDAMFFDTKRSPKSLHKHPFFRNQYKTRTSYKIKTEVIIIQCPEFDEAWILLNGLQKYQRALQEENELLEDFIDKVTSLFFDIGHLHLDLDDIVVFLVDLDRRLNGIQKEFKPDFRWTEIESNFITRSVTVFENLIIRLSLGSPKIEYIEKEMKSKKAKLFLSKNSTINFEKLGTSLERIIYKTDDQTDLVVDKLIVPFWLGRDKMWKIRTGICPSQVKLLLYPFENDWFNAFESRREYNKNKRLKRSNRDAILQLDNLWPDFRFAPQVQQYIAPDPVDSHKIRQRENLIKKYKASDTLEELVNARMVQFKGNYIAFLTEHYDVFAVNHLFDDFTSDKNIHVDLEHLSPSGIQIGHKLLFVNGAEQSAIMKIADEQLPEGTRKKAMLWKKALREYQSTTGLDAEEICQRLLIKGCKRHVNTISNWLENENLIGPRYYNQDLDVIASVTKHQELQLNLESCKKAIHDVWGAHAKTSVELARRVVDLAQKEYSVNQVGDDPVVLSDGVLVVTVSDIHSDLETFPRTMTNKLIEA